MVFGIVDLKYINVESRGNIIKWREIKVINFLLIDIDCGIIE